MNIKSAEFIKGIRGTDKILEDRIPQVAFIGRSNTGKSSVINSLVNRRKLAHSSSTAGKTTEINFFLINNSFYLVDLPGYGYAKASLTEREKLAKLIEWYLMRSGVEQKLIVLIADVRRTLTDYDLEALSILQEGGKNVVIVANKIDKLKQSEKKKQLDIMQIQAGDYKVIPYSAEKKLGVNDLAKEIQASL